MADKRYDQFAAATPTGSRIILHADPATGALNKCTIDEVTGLVYPVSPQITQLRSMGSPFINLPINSPSIHVVNNLSLTQGAGFFTAVYLPACTVSSIAFMPGATGAFTGINFNGLALFSLSGSTITNIRSTANDPNIFKSTVGFWQQAALTSPITVTAGIYYVGVLWCSSATTTTPMIMGSTIFGVSGDYNLLTSPNNYLSFVKFTITSLAGSFTTVTGSSATTNIHMLVPCT